MKEKIPTPVEQLEEKLAVMRAAQREFATYSQEQVDRIFQAAAMAANKVHGVRCGLCTSVEMAHKTKEHNDANVIAFGGRLTEPELAVAMLDEWLDTEFAGKHHTRRVEMLNEM